MKKGKVFTKSHVAVSLMVVALAGAIWLNMKYSDTSKKYLGEATYVSNTSSSEETVETSAKVSSDDAGDYFATVKKEREATRKDAIETVEETLKSAKLTDEEKQAAVEETARIADRMEKEAAIETLLGAKGFEKTVAVIGDDEISIVVASNGLTTAQTLQIQDIVTGQTNIPLANIKIITVG